MPTVEQILGVLTILGVAKILELLVNKFLHRKIDHVSEQKVKAETAKTEVDTIRAVLEEVKEHSATKDTIINGLVDEMKDVKARIFQLEERERHQLTRAAAHEAWDQMSFALLAKHFPNHPPPPPLTPAGDDEHLDPDALPYVKMDQPDGT